MSPSGPLFRLALRPAGSPCFDRLRSEPLFRLRLSTPNAAMNYRAKTSVFRDGLRRVTSRLIGHRAIGRVLRGVASVGRTSRLRVTGRGFDARGQKTSMISDVGIAEDLRRSGLVDVDWYRETYPDVAAAGLDPVEHYATSGAAEGRNPNAFFDSMWYLLMYADVRLAGINPLLHYSEKGAAEGRAAGPAFDTAYYTAENPEVSVTGLNPLLHFLRHGRHEGRTAVGPDGDKAVDLEAAISFVYRHALRREPTSDDTAIWSQHLRSGLTFVRFVLDVMESDEAASCVSAQEAVAGLTDGLFIAHLYEICLGRCALPQEVFEWKKRLSTHEFSRKDLLTDFFGAAVRDERERADAAQQHDPAVVTIMGTDITLTAADWRDRAIALERSVPGAPAPAPLRQPYIVRSRGVRVSAIASLYKGGRYIDKFLSNVCNQSLASDFELIIIDANSPDNEYEVIKQYQKRFSNIRYERVASRIGIYDAWNLGVEIAQGEYLTNTNLDDLRRSDSLELQADVLDSLDFVDVVYQDFYYSFDDDLGFDEVAAFGFKSDLPLVSGNNILCYNSPHNGPMWRRRLHAEVGMFDTTLKSAGDHDMWCRCLLAGKVFYKMNTPHVAYYQNPMGLSTRPGTRGVDEGMSILKKYGRRLVSPYVYMDAEPFRETLAVDTDAELPISDDWDFRTLTQSCLLKLIAQKVSGTPAALQQ